MKKAILLACLFSFVAVDAFAQEREPKRPRAQNIAEYFIPIDIHEPWTNVDDTPLDDLEFYRVFVMRDDAELFEKDYPAPNAAPVEGSIVSYTIGPVRSVNLGETLRIVGHACDNARHPETNEPMPNCSEGTETNHIVRVVDNVPPSAPPLIMENHGTVNITIGDHAVISFQ